MKKIVFCLPGRSFSGEFLSCWTEMIQHCINKQYIMYLSQKYSSNIYWVRSQCLGADVRRGENQKPFDNKIPYDYILWIDSDIIFKPQDLDRLLSHNKDVVGGLYLMEGGRQFAAVKHMNNEYFKQNGSYQFLTPDDISKSPQLIPVDYIGFGFLLIKYGVIESMKYPWFEPQIMRIDDYKDFVGDDVSWCIKARKLGIQIYADPTTWVRHEKTVKL